MGFEWATTTSFAEPMITVGDSTNYYAVDHSPSLLWNSTTWEISEALMPFLRTVMEGQDPGRRPTPSTARSRSRTAACATTRS